MAPPVPDDIYQHDVDFTALALQYPSFSKKLKPNRQLDFTDPESVKQLTLSLLHRDFNLVLQLPDDRLCPPVPNRFNYILFLQHLLATTSPTFRDTPDSSRSVIGLDIGTGASAIYPLLGCRQYPSWKFLCTEIDHESRQHAQSNITNNDLDDRIKILDTDPTSARLIPSRVLQNFPRIDFLMTNPPFYSSPSEMLSSAKLKSRPPNSACTGAPIEMIFPYSSTTTSGSHSPSTVSSFTTTNGGEIAFTTQLLHESTSPHLRHRIQWFSAMLGKLSSLSPLIHTLHSLHITNYALTEFIQGQKTRRWCLAWSFSPYLPPLSLARGVSALEKNLLPFPTEFTFQADDGSTKDVGQAVDSVLEQLEEEDEEDRLSWQWKNALLVGVGMAKADCWSRKARRRRTGRSKGDRVMKQTNGGEDDDEDEDEENEQRSEEEKEPALVFKISVKRGPKGTKDDASETDDNHHHHHHHHHKEKPVIIVRWLQGRDSVLFESFCGWLKRKVDVR